MMVITLDLSKAQLSMQLHSVCTYKCIKNSDAFMI